MIVDTDIVAKYIHGSEDSTDIDVCYVLNRIPSFGEAQDFCAHGNEDDNRNVIHIQNGVVDYTFKGSVDEVNNSIIATYNLHEQKYPLLITSELDRDIPIKILRSLRIILSHISRSQYRKIIKAALRSEWKDKIVLLNEINFDDIDWSMVKEHSKMSIPSVYKTIAFQIGQTLGLIEGKEYYTKNDIAKEFPLLKDSLYRIESEQTLEQLRFMFKQYVDTITSFNYVTGPDNSICFPEYGKYFYQIIGERRIENLIFSNY